MTWNHLQWARNDLKHLEAIYDEQQKKKKKTWTDLQRATFALIQTLFHGISWWNRTPNIEILLIVYLLQDMKLAGYIANHLDYRKLTFAREKLTL